MDSSTPNNIGDSPPMPPASVSTGSQLVKKMGIAIAILILIGGAVFAYQLYFAERPFDNLEGTIYLAAAPTGEITADSEFAFELYGFNPRTQEFFKLLSRSDNVLFRYGVALSSQQNKMAYGELTSDYIQAGEAVGWLQIYTRDLSSGETKQITNSPDDIDHFYKRGYRWDPDGKRLAFYALVTKPSQYSENIGDATFRSLQNWETFFVDTEGILQKVGPGARPDWSSDGRYLVALQDWGLRIYDLQSDTEEVFVHPFLKDGFSEKISLRSGFDISADGKRFAFSNPPLGEILVYQITSWSPFNAEVEQIIDPEEKLDPFDIQFSPKGDYILALQSDWNTAEQSYSPLYLAVYEVGSEKWQPLTEYLFQFEQEGGVMLGDWR